jgi:hypothetical protein
MSFDCTREPCWARTIDEFDGTCVVSRALKRVVSGRRYWRTRDTLAMPSFCGPPLAMPRFCGPPLARRRLSGPQKSLFTRGGKEGRMCATKTFLGGRLFHSINTIFAPRRLALPPFVDQASGRAKLLLSRDGLCRR